MKHVIKTTVFLSDMNNFGAMNEVYAEFFGEGGYPSRSAVEVARPPQGRSGSRSRSSRSLRNDAARIPLQPFSTHKVLSARRRGNDRQSLRTTGCLHNNERRQTHDFMEVMKNEQEREALSAGCSNAAALCIRCTRSPQATVEQRERALNATHWNEFRIPVRHADR